MWSKAQGFRSFDDKASLFLVVKFSGDQSRGIPVLQEPTWNIVPESASARCQALMLMASRTLNGFPGLLRDMPRLPFCDLVRGSKALQRLGNAR